MQNQTKREITFGTQLKTALSEKETERRGRSRMFVVKGGMGLYEAHIIILFERVLRDVEQFVVTYDQAKPLLRFYILSFGHSLKHV